MKKIGILVALAFLSVGAQAFADQTQHSGTNAQAAGQIRDTYRGAADSARSDSMTRASNHGSNSNSHAMRGGGGRGGEHNR